MEHSFPGLGSRLPQPTGLAGEDSNTALPGKRPLQLAEVIALEVPQTPE